MDSACSRAAGLTQQGGWKLVTSPQAFPASERIAKRRDFLRAYDQGRREFARFSTVFIMPNALGHPRLGITVTRKAGKSHDRNRLRRWVRELYRRSRAELGLQNQGIDLVVNVKPAAAGFVRSVFALDNPKDLERLMTDAGFKGVRVESGAKFGE